MILFWMDAVGVFSAELAFRVHAHFPFVFINGNEECDVEEDAPEGCQDNREFAFEGYEGGDVSVAYDCAHKSYFYGD